MFKKLVMAVVGLVVLVVLAAILVPVFVDANKFKPQIQKAVEDNMNADFVIGDLKLSLWGGLHISVSEMILSEKGTAGKKAIFAMKNAKLEIPISSIFGGKPDITLSVEKPEINVITNAEGKMNVMQIMKPSSAQATPQASSGSSNPGAAAALAFDLSFHIVDGHVVYADQKKNTRTDLTGMNLDLRRFGINQKFKFSFKTNLNAKEMKDLTLRGPLSLNGEAAIYVKPSGLERVDLVADADFTGLLIKFSDLFNKSENVALKAEVNISTTEKDLNMKEIKLIANDASITMKGFVQNFDAPDLAIDISSSKFVFEHWQNILKPLKDFDMKGSAQFGINVNGKTAALAFSGKASVSGASLKAPGIVPRVSDLKATLNFSNDSVTLSDAGLKIGNSDLEFTGTVRNFTKPIIAFNMKSQNFDVDSLLPQKTPEQVKAEEKVAASNKQAEAPGMTDEQITAAVAGPIYLMKKNPMMRGMDFTAKAEMKKITVHKAEITNLNTEINFKDLVMSLKKASLQAFGGTANATSSIDFKGNEPSYQVAGEVNGVDINAAVSNQMPMAKDTIFGKTMGKFNISGSGVIKPRVKQTLKGTMHFEIKNGSWNSLTAMKQIGEKMQSLPGGLKDKVAGINITDKFRQLKADVNIAGGRFNVTNMVADMEGPNTVVNGQGWIDFDMNNELGGRIMAPGGAGFPSKNRTADGRMNIPWDIACKVTSPCFKADRLLKELGEGFLKEEGGKAVKKALEKIDNPQVQDLLKKLPF